MKKETKTIRLIYPQWQGANIVKLITEVENPNDASRGYFLGAQLLNFLAPDNGQETLTVPVSTEITNRKVTDGVLDRDIIVRQTRAALNMLQVSNPDKIVTLGGECSVSVAPFTYLAQKYKNDVALIWIDAHPDITLPGDIYPGFHAMAVTACMGYGDTKILAELPHQTYYSWDYATGNVKKSKNAKSNTESSISRPKMLHKTVMRSKLG